MKQLTWLLAFLVCLLAPVGAQGPAPNNPSPAPTAAAAETVPAASRAAPAANDRMKTLLDYVNEGGITVYVLIGLSGIALALMAFLVLTVRRGAVVSDQFMRTADALIRKQDYLGLLAVCNRRNEAISRITQKTLDFATKNPTATFDEVREVTESEGQRQASQLSQRIAYLADIGAVAPMVGLLGTVIGIMKEFGQIAQKATNLNMMQAQTSFAGGTAEALVNTAGGLMIAIPAMIIYAIYKGKVNALISEMEAAATYIMALLAAQYKRVTAARAQQAQQPVRQAR